MRYLNVILFFALLIVVSSSVAQSYNAGLGLGISTSQVDGDGYGGFNKAGPIAGIWVERDFVKEWSVRAEFRYVQKGSHEREKSSKSTVYKLKLNYFELPISVAYMFSAKFGARAGIGIGYLGSAKEFDTNGEIPDDYMVELRKFDFSGFLGLSYKLTNSWILETRISYSIIPICPNQPSIEHWRNFGPYNRGLELGVLYKL